MNTSGKLLRRGICLASAAILAAAAYYLYKGKILSGQLMAAAQAHPDRLHSGDAERLSQAKAVWDFIGVYPAQARWLGEPPLPTVYGHPVVKVIEEVDSKLSDAKL